MQIEKTINTNKATITFYSNDTVEKKYFDHLRAREEVENLKKLETLFCDKLINGWLYKSIKIIDCNLNEKKIIMQRAKGVGFSHILPRKPELSYHMGVWLAHFHNCTRLEDEAILYSDFSRSNFFIDQQTREATAIDVGMHFGNKGYPEIDIVTCVDSLIIGALKAKKPPAKAVRPFIAAYNSFAERKIKLEHIKNSFKIVHNQQRRKNKSKKQPSCLKWIIYLGIPLLILYERFLFNRFL